MARPAGGEDRPVTATACVEMGLPTHTGNSIVPLRICIAVITGDLVALAKAESSK